MSTGTVTSKGQTTVPKHVRDELGLKPGDKIHWKVVNGQAIVVPRNRTLQDLAGFLYDPNRRPMTVEKWSEAAKDAVADHVVGGTSRSR